MTQVRIICGFAVAVLLLASMAPQRRTNFSGHWVYQSAESTGPGRGSSTASGKHAVDVRQVDGAPVNCFTECTIVQNGKTLTIAAVADLKGAKPPEVVLNLDGSDSTITQSAETPATYKAKARWDGSKLVVTRSLNMLSVTQTLAIESGKLTVTSLWSAPGLTDAPVTQIYTKR